MSSTSTVPAFGRRWQLQILTAPDQGSQVVWTLGQDAWEPESLRVTFDIEQGMLRDAWWAEISVYNLNLALQEAVIEQGYEVVLSAGYQQGDNYGVIFRGNVFQVLWDREDVTDYRLTLHCVTGLLYRNNNFVSYSSGPGATMREIVLGMAEAAQTPIDFEHLDSATLGIKVLPRGEGVFGDPARYLSQTAAANGLQCWFGPQGVSLGDPTPTAAASDALVYSSVPDPSSNLGCNANTSYTVIGTPQQIPQGIEMTVLLDARLGVSMPAMLFRLDNTVVRQMQLTPPTLPPILSRDGVYIVAAVRHRGDTRGNEWYTDVTGFTSVSNLISLFQGAQSVRS